MEQVAFRLKHIQNHFICLDDNITIEEPINVVSSIHFSLSNECIISCFFSVEYSLEKYKIIDLEVVCSFEIEEEFWQKYHTKEDNSFLFPEAFLKHLAVLTIGTSRGILFEKTAHTKMNEYYLPMINVNEMIESNQILYLKEGNE